MDIHLTFYSSQLKSRMTQIICLANSWKRGERCIAGINPNNGEWIRPVSDLTDGRIPKTMRQINRREPALLDILEIPLGQTGADFGFEKENRSVLPGKWQKKGKLKPTDLLKYCDNPKYILHNQQRYVSISFMQSLPEAQRQTLQLIVAIAFSAKAVGKRFEGSEKWEGTVKTQTGETLTATITDPVFTRKLELGYRPQNPCLVTVSLSMPWRPDDWEKDDPCWKLIAGVVELPENFITPAIEVETETENDDEIIF